MNIRSAFPSQFLRAVDLGGRDVVGTIKAVSIENLGDGEQKPVVYFQELSTGLVLNKTNGNVLAELLGDETANWTGKRIVLYPARVQFQGKMVDAIRIRERMADVQNEGSAKQAMIAAWQAFQKSHADLKADAMAEAWRGAIRGYFGTRAKEMISASEWSAFVSNGFAPTPTENPISDEPHYTADDIPF